MQPPQYSFRLSPSPPEFTLTLFIVNLYLHPINPRKALICFCLHKRHFSGYFISMEAYSVWSLHSCLMFWGSWCGSPCPHLSSLWLTDVPLCGWRTFCSSTHQWVRAGATSSYWLLWLTQHEHSHADTVWACVPIPLGWSLRDGNDKTMW